ncbi:MAG: PA0069 family radical SAM protein [Halioglobus sp.]|nr:PA0069 family radical SAM protein [Halioglobus sp.]
MQSPAGPHKGRGATLSPANRFAPHHSEWDDGPAGPSPVTECRRVEARSIIARNRSPDVPFGQSINPYQGCEHGCIYCYARPSHAYLDLSPGLAFETRLTYKANAAEQLERELARPGYQCAGITIGANTDPYQPMEKELQITLQLLETMLRTRHPVSLITKSALITRDLDLLAELARQNLCSVAVSVTCLDDDLKRRLEPRAASAQARLTAMAALTDAGVPVTLLYAPVIPALNDGDMEDILALAAAAGARDAAYILLRLPLEIAELFTDWLRSHYPLRADHVMSLLRQSRGGRDNDSRFGHRMRGTGTFADLLEQRFRVACKRLALGRREQPALRTDLFEPPLDPAARCAGQFDLFTP